MPYRTRCEFFSPGEVRDKHETQPARLLPERFAMLGHEVPHNLVDAGFKLGDLERFLKKRKWDRVLTHRLILIEAPPLRIHCDLCAVRATMEAGRNKARRLTY